MQQKEISSARWLFIGPALIHIWWGICVLLSDTMLNTTGLSDIYKLFGNNITITGVTLIVVSILAIASIYLHRFTPALALLILIPQQTLIIIGARTALRCIYNSQYTDGTERGSLFISADQSALFIIGICHSMLVLDIYLVPELKPSINKLLQRFKSRNAKNHVSGVCSSVTTEKPTIFPD
jgi:FlaA1/EpsC-like NDP-sugar epimerase